MRSNQAIRQSYWAHRAKIIPLRNSTHPPELAGDLYEMLTWPTYHVHTAWEWPPGTTGTDRWWRGDVLGYGTLALCTDGQAEATELVVLPGRRREGIASAIRMIQARDLEALGFPVLCQAAPTPEGQAWCATHLDYVGDLPDGSRYYRGHAALIRARLSDRGVRPAPSFTADTLAMTQAKGKAAWQHLARLGQLADLQRAKGALRSA